MGGIGLRQRLPIYLIGVILIVFITVFASISAQDISGFLTATISGMGVQQEYTDELKIDIKEPGTYEWKPANGCTSEYCELDIVKISGEILAAQSGSVNIYLESADSRQLVYSNAFEVELSAETANISEDAINGTEFNENESVISGPNETQEEPAGSTSSTETEPLAVYFEADCGGPCRMAEPLAPSSIKVIYEASPGISLVLYNITYSLKPEDIKTFSLDGKQYEELQVEHVYPDSGSFSAEAWIKTSDIEDAVIVSSGECCGIEKYWAIGKSWSVDMAFFFAKLNDGGLEILGTGTTNIADGEWHHVAFVRDTEDKMIRGYVDAILDFEFTDTAGKIADLSDRLIVGNGNIYQEEWFEGEIARLKTYARALTEDEVSGLYWKGLEKFSGVV